MSNNSKLLVATTIAAATASALLYLYTQNNDKTTEESKKSQIKCANDSGTTDALHASQEGGRRWVDVFVNLPANVASWAIQLIHRLPLHSPVPICGESYRRDLDSSVSREIAALGTSQVESAFTAAANYFAEQVADFNADDTLAFYALYKQACSGDCTATAAELQSDIKKRTWMELSGEPEELAKKAYVSEIIRCVPALKNKILHGDAEAFLHSSTEASAEIGFAKATLLRETLLVEDFATPAECDDDYAKLLQNNVHSETVDLICTAVKNNDTVKLESIFEDRSLLRVPVDKMGSIALHVAADRGLLDVVKLLVACGTDINIQNKDGDSALHCAMVMDRQEICEFLIAAGADTTLKNVEGDDCASCLKQPQL
eukprot:Lankesteria_metandrocarpae@DN3738_c0_g1_i1.p1